MRKNRGNKCKIYIEVKRRDAKIHCGSDAPTCNMEPKEVVRFVNFRKEKGKKIFADNPKKMNAVCIGHTRKFDTWTIFCDRNKDGKPNNFEEQETYTFRANEKKAKRARMQLNCD